MNNFTNYLFVSIGISIFIFLFILTLYILGSIGLKKIADNLGEKNSWIAWLPIFNIYLIGKIAFNSTIGVVLVALGLLSGIFMCFNTLFSLILIFSLNLGLVNYYIKDTGNFYNGIVNSEKFSIATIFPETINKIAFVILLVLIIAAIYKIYSKLSNKAIILTIVTVLSLGILTPAILFELRKNKIVVKNKVG